MYGSSTCNVDGLMRVFKVVGGPGEAHWEVQALAKSPAGPAAETAETAGGVVAVASGCLQASVLLFYKRQVEW